MSRAVCLLLLALLVLIACGARAQAPPRWPAEAWNPRPLEGDLVLPLPCGGAMAFRRVDTPVAASPLADRAAPLGQVDPETDVQEFLRQGHLVGPFLDPGRPGSRHYFIAKYEVTADQYAAVMAESCPELPTPQGRLPRAEVSWAEAVLFTERASAWLHRHARAALPASEGAPGFLRLPTEEEWEYAARGGSRVSEADFAARTYPMPEGIERHAWFQGPRSAAGRARQVGLLAPNPLGLHDMLGNLGEWVLDPFRLNRIGRPHGLAGGRVARGGDFRTPAEALRSSLRTEYPAVHASTSEPLRAAWIGFRPVIARVALPNDDAAAALRRAFAEEAQQREAAAEDPARLLGVLRGELPEGPMRAGLARIESTLLAERRARLDQESVAIRAQMEAAAQIARQIMAAEARRQLNALQAERLEVVARNQRVIAAEQQRLAAAATGALRASLSRQAEDIETVREQAESASRALRAAEAAAPQQMRDLAEGYLRTIRALGALPARRLAEEAALLAREQEQRQLPPWLGEAQRRAVAHVQAAAAGRAPDRESVLRELQAEVARLMAAPAPR